MNVTPSPGWYDDPQRPGWLRRWNGWSWVDEWTPASAAIPPHAPPLDTNSQRANRMRRRSSIVAASLLVPLALVSAGAAVWMQTGGTSSDDSRVSGSNGQPDTGSDADEPSGGDEPASGQGDSGALVDRCGRSDLLTIPGTDISIEPMTLQQERTIGADTRLMVLEQYRVSSDGGTQVLLDGLLAEVEPAQTEIDFTVTLLDSSEVNAFAIPGGGLYFTSGITSLLTEDELAFVMGHEVGHVVCRHLAQQFEREGLVLVGLEALLGTEVDTGRLYAEAASSVLTDIADLGFSRDDELESDLAALDLLAEAGRPLDAGPSALRAIRDLEGNLEPTAIDVFFSTHPPTSERIERLEEEIAQR